MIWNQLQEEHWKIHQYVEIKKHITEQPMAQKKIERKKYWGKRKWKCNQPKFIGCSKSSFKRDSAVRNAYILKDMKNLK